MSSFDEVQDWVVVGSGAGSMCSGLVMKSAGKSVLILEKTDLVGGTTARSGGVMWIPDNPFMKRDGVEDSYDQALTYLDHAVGRQNDAPAATRERRITYLQQAPKMLDFLMGQGIPFNRVGYWPDYYDELPGGSVAGRTVVAEPFNIKELGEWKSKLRPGFLPIPATMDEALTLPYMRCSPVAKKNLARLIGRVIKGVLTGRKVVSAGMALQGRLLQVALRAGIEIRTDSPVSELVIEDGAVKGVVTVKDGKPWRVGARVGVLVNAGGFARNQRMRDQYIPHTSTEWSASNPADTGEMIEEMMRHGIAVAQMDAMIGYPTTMPPGSEKDFIYPGVQRITGSPHAILVDQTGVRYQNEGGSYMAYCQGMLDRHRISPAVPSWAVLDSQYIERYLLSGKSPKRKLLKKWHEAGYLKQGETLEALATEMQVEPATLKETVERFNGFVRQGRDEDFGRGERAYDRWCGEFVREPQQTLGTIEKGPFYAVPVYPGDVSTFGGVLTDDRGRVLKEDGAVIRGLYATGVCTASMMGRIYPGAGGSIGPAMVWGWVAAHHAAGLELDTPSG